MLPVYQTPSRKRHSNMTPVTHCG